MAKCTDDLIFYCGQTNPSIFMIQFDKCADVKTENQKMLALLNFVNECDEAHFRQLCTVSDWATTRRAFIEKYSLPFVLNMERELAKHFDLQCDIRSFVEQKFTALSTYTTLPLLNQMEHILSHLPSEIAILFINNEMMSGPKSKILSFCDGLKDCISSLRKETDEPRVEEDATYAQEPTNKMEVFEFVESD